MPFSLSVYLAQDRRPVVAQGQTLPQRSQGSVLFADISGFTPLTEGLARALGPRRGAEEVAHQLNLVYEQLIAEVERYGGSVVSFAGDAITCWFEGDDGRWSSATALAMQQAMQPFAEVPLPEGGTITLAMKVGIASDQVQRFVVEDPRSDV